jgi:Spy/CpxP family protein refolding chaperone
MKLFAFVPATIAGLLFSSAAVFAQDVNQPVPSQSNPYVAHGGSDYGRARPLNDIELTAITRATEQIELQMAAVDEARQALVAASLASPTDRNAVNARAQALSAAEVALAVARADAFTRVKAEMRFTDPTRIVALANMLNTPGGRPGGGGGGGGNAAPPALTAENILGGGRM